MITTASAFLILWFLWVKKRLDITQSAEGADVRPLPLGHFAWVFLGLIAAVSLAQVHFVRVSALVHERLAEVAELCRAQAARADGLQDIKATVESLRADMSAQTARTSTGGGGPVRAVVSEGASRRVALTRADDHPDDALVSFPPPEESAGKQTGFGREAKAFGGAGLSEPPAAEREPKPQSDKPPKSWSMTLSLTGKVTAESLRVRRSPSKDAEIVERLPLGSEVKITEKRLLDADVWFRIVTPSGGAGWVDYRYIRLPTSPKSASAR
jgi:hypothetical protein